MLTEVMRFYGLKAPPVDVGFFETEHHQQIGRDLKAAIQGGRLIALPILEGQKQALRDAQRALDQAQPGAAGVMESALRHSPALRQAMVEQSGNERVNTLMTGMAQEREALADPHVRADRVVERWRSLSTQRDKLKGWQHDDQRAPVEKAMRQVAEGVGRDPQVESLLRHRRHELGLGKGVSGDSISRELQRSIHYDRDRGLGL